MPAKHLEFLGDRLALNVLLIVVSKGDLLTYPGSGVAGGREARGEGWRAGSGKRVQCWGMPVIRGCQDGHYEMETWDLPPGLAWTMSGRTGL